MTIHKQEALEMLEANAAMHVGKGAIKVVFACFVRVGHTHLSKIMSRRGNPLTPWPSNRDRWCLVHLWCVDSYERMRSPPCPRLMVLASGDAFTKTASASAGTVSSRKKRGVEIAGRSLCPVSTGLLSCVSFWRRLSRWWGLRKTRRATAEALGLHGAAVVAPKPLDGVTGLGSELLGVCSNESVQLVVRTIGITW